MISAFSQYRIPGPAGATYSTQNQMRVRESRLASRNLWSSMPRPTTFSQCENEEDVLGGFLFATTSGSNEKEMIAIAQIVLRRAGILDYAGLTGYFASRDAQQLGSRPNPQRLLAFQSASLAERAAHPGMYRALGCARRALGGTAPDFARGAWFWESATLRIGGARHPRRQAGILFMEPSHNLYHLPDARRSTALRGERLETRAKRNAAIAFETTAAWGSSIFFRHPNAWLRANGVQSWKEYV